MLDRAFLRVCHLLAGVDHAYEVQTKLQNSSIGVIVLINFVLRNAPVKSKGNAVGITNCVSASVGDDIVPTAAASTRNIYCYFTTLSFVRRHRHNTGNNYTVYTIL